MKRITKILIMSLCFLPLLGSCRSNKGTNVSDQSSESVDTHNTNNSSGTQSQIVNVLSDEERSLLSLVDNYEISKSYGYDYSVIQYVDSVVTNSHKVSIRINEDFCKAKKVEYTKKLNYGDSDSQFSETTFTTYFNNGKLVKDNESTTITLEDFAKCNISEFDLIQKAQIMDDLTLVKSGIYNILSFNVSESNSKNFLGITSSVKKLKVEIKVNQDLSKLVSFKISYNQDLSSTCIEFSANYESSNIDI